MAITMKELARLAGVSHTIVSLVLRGRHEGRVSDEKRTEILGLAKKHGYRPNLAARGLVQRRTYRIGLCVYGFLAQRPIIGQLSFHEALALSARRIQEAGYALELIEADPAHRIEQSCRALARRDVDGFALLGWPADAAEKVLLSLREKAIPAAAIGTPLADDGLTWTDVDRGEAIREATRLLLGEGWKRIALLDIDAGGGHRETKTKAFRDEVGVAATDARCAGVFRMKGANVEEAILLARQAMEGAPRPDALVLTDNFLADAVLFVLKERGIAPGKDCRIIGFGDTILADRTNPKLTHYSLMVPEQVRFGLDALLDEIKSPQDYQPRHQVFQPRLILRET